MECKICWQFLFGEQFLLQNNKWNEIGVGVGVEMNVKEVFLYNFVNLNNFCDLTKYEQQQNQLK